MQYAWTAVDSWLLIQISKLIRCCSVSKLSADVICSWLKTISMSGHVVHFTLSRNHPEILGCRQHSPALSGWASCPHARTVTDLIQSALSTFLSVRLCPHSWFSGIDTNSHVRNIAFLTQNSTFHEPILGSSLRTSNHLKLITCNWS